MDKKQLITVSALGALIVALVCFMVIYSESEERLTGSSNSSFSKEAKNVASLRSALPAVI